MRAVVDGLTDAVAVIDGDLRVTLANRAFTRFSGGVESDHLGRPLVAVLTFAAHERLMRILSEAAASSTVLERVPVEIFLEAGRRSLIMTARPMPQSEAPGPFLLLTLRDNNWAHAAGAAETIDCANQQVVEINHRVKNNLAAILAMMRLEGREISDQAARATLKRIAMRVGAVAAIYDLLALERRPGRIGLLAYFKALARSVETMAGNARPAWTIEVRGEDVDVGVDDAMRFGAIVNELVMNAVKYAFDDARLGGRLVVECGLVDDKVTIAVADNGPGIAVDGRGALVSGSSGLGTRLVDLYLGALGGTMERSTAPGRGTTCLVRAPYRAPCPPKPVARARNNLALYKRLAEGRTARPV